MWGGKGERGEPLTHTPTIPSRRDHFTGALARWFWGLVRPLSKILLQETGYELGKETDFEQRARMQAGAELFLHGGMTDGILFFNPLILKLA